VIAFSSPVASDVEDLSDVVPAAAHAEVAMTQTLSYEEADTLHAASVLLSMFAASNDQSFAVAEHVRRVAEYDDLLSRLNDLRAGGRLEPDQERIVFAAESILVRLVNGPLDQQDLRNLRGDVARMELPDRMGMLGDIANSG
jgi:hypothetical protein